MQYDEPMEILFFHERLEEFLVIEKMLSKERLLIDPYNVESDHPCHLVNYQFFVNTQFNCLLDRNVVSYLIALVQGHRVESNKSNDCYRLTSALQAFLNAAGINSEPGLAYLEYVESSGLEKADNELSLFRSADNLNANIYLDIALGLRDSVDQTEVNKFETGELKSRDYPQRLHHFESNIVFLKKALSLKAKGLSDYNTMLELLDWIYKDYMFSAPAFHFLSIYFSSQKISKMLKSHSVVGIRNATWDLCFLQYLITLVKKSKNTQWLFSTFDKAIKTTANLAFKKVNESKSDYLKRLENLYAKMWGKKDGYGKKLLERYENFVNSIDDTERKMVKFNGSKDYVLKLREEVDQEFQNCVLKQNQ